MPVFLSANLIWKAIRVCFCASKSKNELAGKFAAVSLKDYKTDDRQIFPTKRADYIARVNGTRNYPWRAMIVAENDANLITNQLIYKLAPEAEGDYSWVRRKDCMGLVQRIDSDGR